MTPELLMRLLLLFSVVYMAACFRQVWRDLFPKRNRRRLFTKPIDERGAWIRRLPVGGLDWIRKATGKGVSK
jgi:hypothetical protein